jgi:hypothetical protein
LILVATLVFACIALILLVRPPLILRIFAGSEDRASNTATWRVQMRGVGLYFSIVISEFVLMAASHSKFMVAFRHNLNVASLFAPVVIPIVLWIIWLIWLRPFIRYAQIEGINEDPRWELRITLLFCSLLLAVFAVAFVLAAKQTAQSAITPAHTALWAGN